MAVGVGACATVPPRRRQSFFERVNLPIGIQIYTLGDAPEKDMDGTFAALARIGYREIELPGLYGKSAGEIRAAADHAGLTIGSIHLGLVSGQSEKMGLSFNSPAEEVAETLNVLGAQWVVVPAPQYAPNTRLGQSPNPATDLWKYTADQLNQQAALLKPMGIKTAYHNHNGEFAPLDGKTGWEILTREADPNLVSFEVDLGWVATAGLDPVSFLKTLKGRARLVHVKDVGRGTVTGFSSRMIPIEVGSGQLDWAAILPAAYDAGCGIFMLNKRPLFPCPGWNPSTRAITISLTLSRKAQFSISEMRSNYN